jgi:hypothetical protein
LERRRHGNVLVRCGEGAGETDREARRPRSTPSPTSLPLPAAAHRERSAAIQLLQGTAVPSRGPVVQPRKELL